MEVIRSDGAATAIGPYSQAIRTGQFLFVSGQVPLDPSTGQVVSDDIADQTHRVLRSLEAILKEVGATLGAVVRTTVFLVDLEDFSTVNKIYATYFCDLAPARSTVQVVALPKAVRIEIDAIAVLPES